MNQTTEMQNQEGETEDRRTEGVVPWLKRMRGNKVKRGIGDWNGKKKVGNREEDREKPAFKVKNK